MGGSVFTQDSKVGRALYCPRLPPELYFQIKDHLTRTLKRFFRDVATPYEAPEKPDHGDIDFLVHGPLKIPNASLFNDNHLAELCQALSAVRCEARGPGQRSFAVPVASLDHLDENGAEKKAYAQVDLTHCSQLSKLRWLMLTHSYGDIFQILGVQLRPLGLTFLQDCFVTRISPRVFSEDLEHCEKGGGYGHSKRSRELDLSREPEAVLEFLGLDLEKWEQGFASLEECYEWIVAGRLFDRRTFEKADEELDSAESGWNGRQKARDKRRKRLRSMYRRFVEEWLPSHPEAGLKKEIKDEEDLHRLRMEVLTQALAKFGKQKEYEEIVEKLRVREAEDVFWSAVRKRLPLAGEQLGRAMRGLKRWVSFEVAEVIWVQDVERQRYRVVRKPPVIRSEALLDGKHTPQWLRESGLTKSELMDWIDVNWQEVKQLEREREKAEHRLKKSEQG